MDLNTLKEKLSAFQQANQGNITFPIPASAPAYFDLPDPINSLFALFDASLGEASLTIKNAVISEANNAVTVSGEAELWQAQTKGIVATFVDNEALLQLTLAVPLPPQWKFSTSFSLLEQSMYDYLFYGDAPTFIYTTIPGAYQGNSSISLQTGLNFLAVIRTENTPLEILKTLSDTLTATVYGAININPTTPQSPNVILQSTTTIPSLNINKTLNSIIPVSILVHDTKLKFLGSYSYELDRYLVNTELDGGTWQSKNPDLNFPAQLNIGSNLVISGDLSGAAVSAGFSALSQLAGGELLVDGLKELEKSPLSLTAFQVQIYTPELALVQLSFNVGLTTGSLTIVPNLMVIKNIQLEFQISAPFDPGRSLFFTFLGMFQFGNIEVDLSAQYSQYLGLNIQGSLPQTQTMDFKSLADYLSREPTLAPLAVPISLLPTLSFSAVNFFLIPAANQFSISATLSDNLKSWEIVPEFNLSLDQVQLALTITDQAGISMAGTVRGFFEIGGTTLEVVLTLPFDQLQLSGNQTGAPINVADLIEGINKTIGVSGIELPAFLHDIQFDGLGLDYKKTTNQLSFSGVCQLSMAQQPIMVGISIDLVNGKGTYRGFVYVASKQFSIIVDKTTDSMLAASWSAIDEIDYLKFEEIAGAFGFTFPDIPPNLDLALESAFLTYTHDAINNTHMLALSAESANYGNAVFVSLPVNGTQEYFFLLGVDQTFSLSNLPLVGNELASIENIQVGDFQVIIGSKPADTAAVTAINALIATLPAAPHGSSYPKMPDTGTTGDFVLSAQIDFGDRQHSLPLMLSMGGSGTVHAAAPTTALATTATGGTVTPSTSPDGTIWFTVQKSFGEVTIERIGAMYQPAQQTLWFEIDASLAMGPMSLTMVGLGIGSSIADFAPKFSLQGMGIAYTKPPLAIAGSFVNLNPPQGLEFEGSVMIGAESFELEAFGFYGDQKGSPSMFIFGDLAKSFGGPPAFFVTGAALGFGYNSALRLPNVDQVASFPFIEVLPNSNPPNTLTPPKSPQEALNVIITTSPPWVAEQPGALWFAAGITFTSFEIVNSQALVIVEPGTDLTISLIGTSQAQFPQDTGAGGPVYAYLALDLDAVFKPEEGVFSLQAVLSRASFLLDRSCVLTGGFAFYIWFGDNPHSGDFVLTLGGYNPGFLPPSYYPAVPPLGFHWSVDSSITVSGNAYLAFTPSVMMMGGELSAVYQSGDLKAWFDAHADIIVQWKPFWFDADIGITIGASYRVDLLFTSFTVSVELGCDLQLWGPPTGGSVYVDWYIISFTVPFGASKSSEPVALIWADVQAMLPNTGTPEAPNILSLTPTTGFTPSSTKPAGGSPPAAWIVRGSQFGFSTSSPIPATTATVGGTYAFKGSTFNVAPLDWIGVSATHEITITDASDKPKDWSFAFAAQQIQKSLPSSLWGSPPSTTPRGDSQLVANQIVGVTLQVNPPQIGSSAGAVNVELYLEGVPLDLPGATLPISEMATPSGDIPINSQTTISTIANTKSGIAAIDTVAARNAIFDALQTAGYAPIGTNDPMTNFAKEIGCALNAEPLLVA